MGTFIISGEIIELQQRVTLYLLRLFLEPGQIERTDIVISPHFRLYITNTCTGLPAILFYLAALIAYPASIRHKVLWFLVGYGLITLLNIARILFIVYLVKIDIDAFELAHDVVGNAAMGIAVLLLFILFVRSSRYS